MVFVHDPYVAIVKMLIMHAFRAMFNPDGQTIDDCHCAAKLQNDMKAVFGGTWTCEIAHHMCCAGTASEVYVAMIEDCLVHIARQVPKQVMVFNDGTAELA